MAALFLAACATALATGLGALPVYVLGRTELLHDALWGVAAGVMAVAAVQGLLLPGLRASDDAGVVAGALVGVAFLLVSRALLRRRELRVGVARGADARRALLVFGVLLVHSLPEGLALGAAWAEGSAALSAFVFAAIALQNVPEGTAVGIPLRDAGESAARAFWAATLTSVPQPVGALAAYAVVESTRSILGPSFGFAAGAMLALVLTDVAPAAVGGRHRAAGAIAALAAAAATAGLGFALSVE